MTRFRPCIDLHDGRVKQIVGGSLSGDRPPTENHVAEEDADHRADLPDHPADGDERNAGRPPPEPPRAVRPAGDGAAVVAVEAGGAGIELAGALLLQDVAGIVAGPPGHLLAQHVAGEQPVDLAFRQIAAEPVIMRQLQELELADMEQVGRLGDLRPFGGCLELGPEDDIEKVHHG